MVLRNGYRYILSEYSDKTESDVLKRKYLNQIKLSLKNQKLTNLVR
jgi:hypothetical protein